MKEGWTYKKLGEVYDVRDGTHDSPKYQSKGYPLVTSKNLRDGILDMSNVNFISQLDYNMINQRSKVDVGDVLFAMIGTIGNPVYVEDEPEYAIKNMALFKVPENQSGKFLRYFLLNDNILSKMQKESKGTTQKFVSLGYLRNFIISIPTLSEQQRIVSRLDAAFAHIDELKANAEKQLSEARALFQKALTKAMEPKEGWEEKRLPEISENLDSMRKPVTKKDRTEGIYPYYGASGIVDYVDDYIFDENLLCISEDGANLLMRTYPIAFPISGKVWVNNHAHVLRFKCMTTQRYIEYFFAGIKLDEYITGAAQPKLTQKALNNITINIPDSIEEQQRIVSRLDSLSAHVRELEEVTQKTIAECDALKQALLRKVFE